MPYSLLSYPKPLFFRREAVFLGVFQSLWGGGRDWRSRHGEPKNRRQLFLAVLSDQFFSLMPVNLLFIAFYIPAVLLSVYCLLGIAAAAEGGAAQETIGYMNLWVLGMVPCIMLTGPARAGMALLMRNWAREQYTPPFRTFFRGLRDNWKQSAAVSFATGVVPAGLWYCYLVSSGNGTLETMRVLMLLAAIAYAVWLLALQSAYTLMVTYELPLRQQLRNALLLTLMKLPTAALIFLSSSFFLLLYAAFVVLRPEMRYSLLIVPGLYYLFIGGSMTQLIFASYANMLCDKYLSSKDA